MIDKTASDVRTLFAEALRCHQLGQLAEAQRLYRRLLQREPRHADALHLLGAFEHQVGRNDVALALITRAIRINRAAPAYYANLGLALKALRRTREAAAATVMALLIDPAHADAHNNLGNILFELERLTDAAAACRSALRIKPDHARAHYSLGNVLQSQGSLREAGAAYRVALCIDPGFAQAYSNQGDTQKDLGHLDDAIAACRAALRLDPGYADARSNLLLALHYQSGVNETTLLEEARRFALQVESDQPQRSFANSADPDRRLRIGYMSGDFHRHPVGYFLRRVLDNHDPTSVEIFCYSNFSRADDLTTRLQESSDHWRSLVGLSDQAAADLIIADGIDILVDLSGHTAHNRLSLFARKPAPIQVTWLGFWGTTGLSRMDYILSDAVMIRPGEERFYSEIVLRLPHGRFCYDPPDYAPTPVPPPALRGSPITFGSFNNLAKIGPDVVRQWSEVLRAVPRSRLLLKWKTLSDAASRRGLAEAFAATGIGADRLELRGASPHAEMLAEYGDIDIALDPFPFSGGLTSCEALWMGVPVITLPGTSASSRQTHAILDSLGFTEWVAASPADLLGIACSLTADLPRLAGVRAGLRDRVAGSPLCDGAGFTAELEKAYRAMWRVWCGCGHTSTGVSATPAVPNTLR